MTVKITRERGQQLIDIDGVKHIPVAFRSFRPQPYNVQQFYRMGVRLFQMLVSGKRNALGDMYSLYGGVWSGNGEYNFDNFDKQMQMFMKYAPNGYFLIMIQLDTPDWWLKENPEYTDSFQNLGEMSVCEKWKKDAAEYLKALINYAEEKYGDRIFGYSYSCGLCTEWFVEDHGRKTPEKLRLYREYTKNPNAVIPDLTQFDDGDECDLRAVDSNELEYMNWCCELNSSLVNYFAAAAREVIGHKKLIGVFFGYLDQGTAFKQNLWFTNIYDSVWKNHDIDMLFSPASYNDNRFFDGVPMYQYAVDSVSLNDKLYIHELDHRTDLAKYPLSTGFILQDCCNTQEESVAVLRREFANVLLKSGGMWWFDFYGGYFSNPDYEAELKRQIEIYRQFASEEKNQVANVAVFADTPSMNCMKERVELVPECVRANLTEITKSGAMINTFNLSDITRIDAGKYKIFVFLDALNISDEVREYINGELADKYKFFVYSPDYISGKMSTNAIEKITGMHVEKFSGKTSLSAVYKGTAFGFSKPISPMFKVCDGTVETLAEYTDKSACVCKKGKTFYSAVGNIPYTLWQDVFKSVGVHIYSDCGCYTAVTDKFVAHQNTKGDICSIKLPYDCEFEEMFDGGKYKTENCTLCYKAPVGSTKLFRIIR